jgi:hypothetical protein
LQKTPSEKGQNITRSLHDLRNIKKQKRSQHQKERKATKKVNTWWNTNIPFTWRHLAAKIGIKY